MAVLAGKDGIFKIGASDTVASVQSWSLDASVDMLESTALGDDAKTYISGLFGATGSAEAQFRVHDDTSGQTALNTAFLAGTSVTAKLYVNATNYYSGTAFISSLSVSNAVADITTITFSLQFTGAVSFN